jgi:hypothetical protein
MKNIFIIFLVSITSLTYAQNSILFDASDQQYLTISNADDRFNATADFTYEIWVKFTSKGFNGQRLAPFFGGQQHDYVALIDNRIGMRLNSNSVCSGDRTFGSTSTIGTDTWYHIAYVRSGSVVSLYLDGTLLGTTECAQEDGSVKGVWMINANTINIGAIFWNTSYLDGYIGGMRYIVGSALYSGDFTPQLRWEKTNETILLMNIKNEGAAFTDESDYSNTINLNGSSSTPTFVAGNGPTLPADILLSGDVSIENNSIKNVADPVYAQDAATKSYVDSNVNSFSGSYNDLSDKPTSFSGDLSGNVTSNFLKLNPLTQAEIDNLNPEAGTIVFNADSEKFIGYSGSAGQELDQSQENQNQLFDNPNTAQSFTAGSSGSLSKIDVKLSNGMYGQPDNNVTLTLREGEGTEGNVLFSTGLSTSSSTAEWISVDISGVEITQGSKYTIHLTSTSFFEDVFMWARDNTNPYPNGKSFYSNTAYTDYDLCFKTYISTTGWIDLN